MTGILNTLCLHQVFASPRLTYGLLRSQSLALELPGRRAWCAETPIPSWSWADWSSLRIGSVPPWDCDQDCSEWLEQETYIVWYTRKPGSRSLDSVFDPRSQSNARLKESDVGYHRKRKSFILRSADFNEQDEDSQPRCMAEME